MEYGNMGPADLAAVMGNNGNGYNDGYGFGGGAWWWIIILFLFGMNGGWGRGGFGGGYGNGDGVGSEVQRGFDQSAVMSGMNGVKDAVTAGFGNVQTALCNGFAGVANGFAQAEIAENARQMANMNQMFGVQSALQQCCCDNKAATADLKYTVATEACADRTAATQNTRDIIESQRNGTQAILDKLCALELDGVKAQLNQALRDNSALQDEITRIGLGAQMQSGFAQEVDNLYNRLNSCPVPTTPVYGRTPIFTCGNNGYAGCGCGM